VAGVLALLFAACTTHAPSGPPSLAIVTVDTWRADHLDARHTPHLWSLASRGWRFTDVHSPVGLTTPAHATILTGRQPWHHGMRANNHHGSVLSSDVPTLATLARDAGWRTAAFVSAWPAGPSGGMDRGFETFDGPDAGERPGGAAVDGARAWLASLPVEARFLLWVHVYEPHGPYLPPEADLRAVGGDETDRDRYGGEVHAADRLLGTLLDDLAARSVVVTVAGDHGEILDEETCAFQHERSVGNGVLGVPLVVAGPGVDVRVRDGAVTLADIAPTLLALAGLPAPGGMDGVSLVGGDPVRPHRLAESGMCEPACAVGCAPVGILGRDRVVFGAGWRILDRPGRGRWMEGTGAPWTGWDGLFAEIPVITEPEGAADAKARGLGYQE